MTQLLVKIAAKFNTTLNLKTAIGATSATLDSATDDSGVALPTGRYALTIDGGTSSEEFITCTLTGTALTSIKHVTMQGVESSGTTILHRKGATVKITDFAVIKKMLDLLDGTTSFDASTPLGYDGTATISTANQFATKAYADGLAIAGSPDSSTTVKGIGKVSVAPVSATSPIFVGDNDPRVPTTGENDALVGNNTDIAVGTGNKFVTQTGFQKNSENYGESATGNDTYFITLSPVPTSYVNGMRLRFKPDTANTGAATLNVNSLGAISLVTGLSTALATGDILANQVCEVVYNSTGPVFQLLNPASARLTAPVLTSNNGTTTKDTSDASGTQTIAHGLPAAPKSVNIRCTFVSSGTYPGNFFVAESDYNGTTQSSNSVYSSGGTVVTDNTFRLGPSSAGSLNYQTGVITVDATNIYIAWTKTNTPTGTYQIKWRASTLS